MYEYIGNLWNNVFNSLTITYTFRFTSPALFIPDLTTVITLSEYASCKAPALCNPLRPAVHFALSAWERRPPMQAQPRRDGIRIFWRTTSLERQCSREHVESLPENYDGKNMPPRQRAYGACVTMSHSPVGSHGNNACVFVCLHRRSVRSDGNGNQSSTRLCRILYGWSPLPSSGDSSFIMWFRSNRQQRGEF